MSQWPLHLLTGINEKQPSKMSPLKTSLIIPESFSGGGSALAAHTGHWYVHSFNC